MDPVSFLARHGLRFPAWDLERSRRYTRNLARTHYENFTVAGLMLPRRLRQDYCNVYAYCRWADDLGDEIGDPQRSLELLAWWGGELREMRAGRAYHPVFVALRDTAERHDLPPEDFENLLRAFEQDQTHRRYASYVDLLGYCIHSANPVGRLVLRLNGCRDEALFQLSDATCTALQLANHWQDVRRDWQMDRIYMPEDVMRSHGYSPALLGADARQGRASPAYRATLQDLCARAARLFSQGLPLADHFGGRLGLTLEAFSRGGLAILDKIRAQDWDTLACRPTISQRERAVILLRLAARRALPAARIGPVSRHGHA